VLAIALGAPLAAARGPGADGCAVADAGPGGVFDDASMRATRRSGPGAESVGPSLPAGTARLVIAAPAAAAVHLVADTQPPAVRRVATPPGLLPSIRAGADGRDAWYATCDGWIGRIDAVRGERVVEARVARRIADFAVSADAGHVAVASLDPPGLLVFDRALEPLRRLPGADASGARPAGVVAVGDATARRSFVAALPAIGELWEVSYDRQATEIATGTVHDFRLREGAFVAGYLNARRAPLERAPDRLRVDAAAGEALVASGNAAALDVVQLDVRRRIATVPLAGAPLPERGAALGEGAARRVAVPLRGGGVVVVASRGGTIVATLPTPIEIAATAGCGAAARVWLAPAGGREAPALLVPLDAAHPATGEPMRVGGPGPIVAIACDAAGDRLYAAAPGERGWVGAFDARGLRPVWRVPLAGAEGIAVLPHAGAPASR
jgi:hypothetical protein